jgi:hypothetical protein
MSARRENCIQRPVRSAARAEADRAAVWRSEGRYDEAAITFLSLGVGSVIVDAVTIEGQRRVAKQEWRRRLDLSGPPGVIGRRRWRRCRLGRLWLIPVDNVLLFNDSETVVI